ncbi:MAG: hypothetical protein ABJL72_00660 [Roseobacter sp.]
MTICDCDTHDFPPLLSIAPGLSRLPRQIGTFGDFRAALLAQVREHSALSDWRARDQEDFGLLLLDWWAYVSDVIAFYNAEHVQDLYLSSARDEERIRRLVGLIGYRPRPALAAQALIAGIVEGSDPVLAPALSGFIADAAGDTPPQEFELETETTLDPLRNRWTVAPVRDPVFDPGNILIDPGSRSATEGSWLAVSHGGNYAPQRLLGLFNETALDGASYIKMELSNTPTLPPAGTPLSDISIWSFSQNAPVHAIDDITDPDETDLTLVGLFTQIRVGELALIEDSAETDQKDATVGAVTSVSFSEIDLLADISTETIKTAVTIVRVNVPTDINAASALFRFGRLRAGKLVAPAKPFLDAGDISARPLLTGRHDGAGLSDLNELLLKGARDQGAHVPGNVVVNNTGQGTLTPAGSFAGFDGALRAPVEIFGNVMRITRGKSVQEQLGSGKGPGVPFQSFTLAKSPLTYLSDPKAKGGARSSLQLHVDGILWTEVESLFLYGAQDRVYTVDLDSDGKATVTFGDGQFGLPPSLGVGNVSAQYRFGAGDPAPKANTIRQIAGPVPKLRRIFNVTDAYGGGPGDLPQDIRFNAPASSASFDRAISASDFAALARNYGALAAVAVTEWVPDRLREGVVVVAIFEGQATQNAVAGLEAHLVAKAAEATPIRVVAATPYAGDLRLSYATAVDANPAQVAADLRETLLNPFTGFLAPRQAEIGGPVFRSAILGRAAKVNGIDQLIGLTWAGAAMPARFALGAHDYFAPNLILEEVAL